MSWLVAVPLAIFTIFTLWRIVFILRATKIVGQIVEIKMGGDDNDLPGPVVEYVWNGEVRRLESKWYGSPYMKSKVGDPLTVYVVGDHAKFATVSDLWLFPIVLLTVTTGTLLMIYFWS